MRITDGPHYLTMKLLAPLLLLSAILGARAGDRGCFSCPEEDGVLPHPTDCSSYVVCTDGTATFGRCPPGQVFSHKTLRCDLKEKTQCEETWGPRQLESCPKGIFDNKAPRHSGSLSTSGACAQDCSAYAGFVNSGETHSVCAATCQSANRGISIEAEEEIVQRHNELRQHLALGLEDGAPIGSNLPSATNMNRVVWNGELAKVAQGWADTCNQAHDCGNCRKITSRTYAVGQNAYWLYSGNSNPPKWSAPVDMWYDEVKNVESIDWLSSFGWDHLYQIGHFTQVSWANVYEVGCGYTAYLSGSYYNHGIFCNYGPSGNWLGEAVYDFGDPATKCSQGVDAMDGMCTPPDVVDPCEA